VSNQHRSGDRHTALPADPVVDAYKQAVDRSLLRQNLTRSPEERFLQLMELQRFAAELQRAGKEARATRE